MRKERLALRRRIAFFFLRTLSFLHEDKGGKIKSNLGIIGK